MDQIVFRHSSKKQDESGNFLHYVEWSENGQKWDSFGPMPKKVAERIVKSVFIQENRFTYEDGGWIPWLDESGD